MKFRYVVIDTSTYRGDDDAKANKLQEDLNTLGDSGFHLVEQSGPLFIMEASQ